LLVIPSRSGQVDADATTIHDLGNDVEATIGSADIRNALL
jgi:hypothetical protein